jgi:TolA-binding protein
MSTKYNCVNCGKVFKTNSALKSHKSRSNSAVESGNLSCVEKMQRKRQKVQIDNMSREEIREAVNISNQNETTNALLEDLRDQLGRQNVKMDSLIQQNEDQKKQNEEQNKKISELKDMMIDMQNNPRLLMICNNLYPLEELNLKAPEFKPVLEILDKELPEYPNLGNSQTGMIHAKAIKTLNCIKLTAIKEGEDVFFKTENILAKDNDNTTTRAFIDAIGKMGYEYAQKAIHDLKSERESDICFQNDILENATKNALPDTQEISYL